MAMPVLMRIVRSDGAEFTIDNARWKMSNKALEGWGEVPIEVSSVNNAAYDGGMITHQRVGIVERTLTAEVADARNNATARAQVISFFNPRYKFKAYLTYQGRTRWCEGVQSGFKCETGNIYERTKFTWSILCPMPYLLSVDDFGKDIAAMTPKFGFPLACYVWSDVAFQEIEAHAPKARLWNTPLPNSQDILALMNDHRTMTFEGDLTLFREQPQGIASPNNCAVFIHDQFTGAMYKLFQLQDTSWTNVPKVFNITVDVDDVIATQIAAAESIPKDQALQRAKALDLTDFTVKAFGWQASANGRPTVADAEFIMRASIGSIDGGNPYPEIYPRGFITGLYEFGDSVEVENNGDVPTFPRVIIKAKGEVKNPKISIGSKFVRVVTTLHVGDVLEINFDKLPPSVTINGNNAMHMVDKQSSFSDFVIDLGISEFRYAADVGSNAMGVSLYWFKRYLGI